MPGSSESGAVPINRVTVPPDFDVEVPVDAVVVVDDELDELPHAAIASTELIARTAVRARLEFLLTTPPPKRLSVGAKSRSQTGAGGGPEPFLINPQQES